MKYNIKFFIYLVVTCFSFLTFTHFIVASESYWDLLILDGAPPVTSMGSFSVDDVDNDGKVEMIVGGDKALLWYQPATFDKGIVGKGDFHVGNIIEDIDDDGIREVIVGELNPETSKWMITWYKPQKDLHQPWKRYIIDTECLSGAHCLIFVDLNGDGEKEIVANATYSKVWGVFAYKRNKDITKPWIKQEVQTGYAEEGLAAADLDSDGNMDIVSGPNWYSAPAGGPFSGTWEKHSYATNFREMVRVALADITGNGRMDIVITESEYPDGIMSWFENRLKQNPEQPWVEHRLFDGLNFAHSFGAWGCEKAGKVRVFVGEMMKGGWDAPYNFNARLMEFTTEDFGKSWQNEVLYKGAGTHEATQFDIDGDGQYEIVGKEWGKKFEIPKVQIWKKRKTPSPLTHFRHRLLDRDKPYTGTDILATDVDGDGKRDVVCAAWWYKNNIWERYQIPGIYQIHLAYDIDNDGRDELIATKEFPTESTEWYPKLSSELCWLDPVDPVNGKWKEYEFGRGSNGWPHGVGIGPVLPKGQLAFFATYHGQGCPMFKLDPAFKSDLENNNISKDLMKEFKNSGHPLSPKAIIEKPRENRWSIKDEQNKQLYHLFIKNDKLEVRGGYPEIFEIPKDPQNVPWPKRVLADIVYGEEFMTYDLDGDGKLDIMAGPFWLENKGDGTFTTHRLIDENLKFQAARFRVADINADGNADIVVVEEDLSYQVKQSYFARFAWFENPGDPKKCPWQMHIIDKIRSPHSLDIADLDGDGELEIVCAEHDPFKENRSQSRLFIYKKANKKAQAWYRYLLDGRFEHHCGTKIFEVEPGRFGIISHGWKDRRYVHLWEAY